MTRFRFTGACALLLAAMSVHADVGINDPNWKMIPAMDFHAWDSATGSTVEPATGTLVRTSGGGTNFSHVIDLPRGAFLVDVTVWVRDNDPDHDVVASVVIQHYGEGGSALSTAYTAATSGQPGETFITIPVNHVLNQSIPGIGDLAQDWNVVVSLDPTNGATGFSGVRVRWNEQVSSAPATATFTDVPTTHPLFRYIEALASAGITTGCAPNQYCPDSPVTRGQIAVFIARALGLHWVP